MGEKPSILVVDDEKVVRESLYHWFTEDGYRVEIAANAVEALDRFEKTPCDVLLVDIKMPGMDGLELQQRLKGIDPGVVIIIMTAYASVATAVRALKNGAYDYIIKPFDPEDLAKVISSAFERQQLMRENVKLKERIESLAEDGLDEIIGEDPCILEVKDLIRTVAPSDSTVLINGESGTGKELVAKAIHKASPRRHMPLVAVNCAGLPDGLVESELFGHEKGAFTGAEFRRKGKFELAHQGTIFIDEIGDIPPKTQVDLLRVLEDKTFTRIGSSQPMQADFRVIAATNRDLRALMEEKKFRLDLYYRINVFPITLPPLRQRRSDIPLLARHFLAKSAVAMGRKVPELSPEALEYLVGFAWPGNIRELQNAMERGTLVCSAGTIRHEDLPILGPGYTPPGDGLSLEEFEQRHIQTVLEKLDGNVTQAARALGIDRVTLYNKIKKYGLKR